jgi:hypothetical protein
MATLESTVHRILDTLHSNGSIDEVGERYRPSPGTLSMNDSIIDSRALRLTAIISSQSTSRQTKLTHRVQIERLGQVFLTFCADQPLPLFQRDGFVESLLDRADAALFAIIANSMRHAPDIEDAPHNQDCLTFRDAAHTRIMADIGRGNVHLFTLQALCLVVFFDFTSRLRSHLTTTVHTKLFSRRSDEDCIIAHGLDFDTRFER